MSKEWEPENVFDILGDDLARRILMMASRDPVSVETIAEHCDVALPTVYRRVNALTERDLLSEQSRVAEDGHHHKCYQTTLREITLRVAADGFTIDLQRKRDLTDHFEDFWGEFDRSSHLGNNTDNAPERDHSMDS